MRIMCVGRYQFLSEHLARYFDSPGVDAMPCVGMGEETGGIAGFMYLPTQNAEGAHRVLAAVRRKTVGINPPSVLKWQDTTQVAGYR